MSVERQQRWVETRYNYLERPGGGSSLADVVDLILDKGMVIDAYIRISLVGIELLTIDARIVIASVDTYLRFAEAVNRVDLTETEVQGIPELMEDMTSSGAKQKTKGALEGAKDRLSDKFGRGDDDEDEGENENENENEDENEDEGRQPARQRRRRGKDGD